MTDRVNPMIFVDIPCPDPEAMSNFYADLFGWTFNRRPAGEFHEVLPGALVVFLALALTPDTAGIIGRSPRLLRRE